MTLSAKSGAGLPELLARIERSASHLMEQGAGAPPLTRARHREALMEAHASLGRALKAPEIALSAEDLRLAMRALGRITGTVRDRRTARRHLPRLLHRQVGRIDG